MQVLYVQKAGVEGTYTGQTEHEGLELMVNPAWVSIRNLMWAGRRDLITLKPSKAVVHKQHAPRAQQAGTDSRPCPQSQSQWVRNQAGASALLTWDDPENHCQQPGAPWTLQVCVSPHGTAGLRGNSMKQNKLLSAIQMFTRQMTER